MSGSSWELLAAAAHGLIDLRSFETWLYQNAVLESEIGERNYLDLISFDFTQADAKHELGSLVERVQRDGGRVASEDVAAYLAHEYLNGRVGLATIARVLAAFWSEGAEWVPSEFAYISSDLDTIPLPPQYPLWDSDALRRKLAESGPMLQAFEEGARNASTELLVTIEARRRNRG
jgi:hypothetical protein